MRAYIKAAGLTVALVTAPVPAYADDYTLAVTPSAVQTIRYDRGIASIDSVQEHSIVRIVNVAGNDKKTVSFIIGVVNAGGQPLNFGPENITISPAEMQPIALTTYEDAMEAERKMQGREKFWAGLAAFGRGLSTLDAGTTYSSGSYSGTASGYVGNNFVTAQTHGSYSGTEYNSGAELAAQRDAREMNAQDRAELEEKWANRLATANNLLRTTTVDPGMMYGGIAIFPISKEIKRARGPVQVTIEVDVAGEKHTFLARLADAPLSASDAQAIQQQSLVARPVSTAAAQPTLEQRMQATVDYIRTQIPSPVGGNGSLIDVQSRGNQLLFVVKFNQASVPADGKVKLQEVCTSELLVPLLERGATLRAAYLDGNGARIGSEDVYPSNCGFR